MGNSRNQGQLPPCELGKDTISLAADPAIGGSSILLRNQAGTPSILLHGDNNALVLNNKANKGCVWLHADPVNGGSGINLRDQNGKDTIILNGDTGDVILPNADCAE